jgi:hypothetical protein
MFCGKDGICRCKNDGFVDGDAIFARFAVEVWRFDEIIGASFGRSSGRFRRGGTESRSFADDGSMA